LRQAAAAAASSNAYLFKPEPGVRIRFGTNDPTPWPPELPAGENPPPGAIVDYYLPSNASDVKLEFLNAAGQVLRTYANTDPVRKPDPATDPVAYNKLCQATPGAQDCGLPLYWPAPPQILKTTAGMHRFTWDMHYDVIPGGDGGGRGGGAGGAVPHRTYPTINSPWVSPGDYTVRLTAGGQTVTQPIHIVMDPRVKITSDVRQIFTITERIEASARTAVAASKEVLAELDRAKGNVAVTTKLEEILPALNAMGAQLVASVMSMQGAEMAPTALDLAGVARQEAAYTALMARWTQLKGAL
jgi:hypothetical protein